jgi:hypothetical protein
MESFTRFGFYAIYQTSLKIFFQANAYLLYPYMNNDKYFNHAIEYCLNEQVHTYFLSFSIVARSIGVVIL